MTIERKARQRIKRFIQTGLKQARVRQESENVYQYHAKHHITLWRYKKCKKNLRKLR